jgi:integrase
MQLTAKVVGPLKLDGKKDAIFFDGQMPGFGYRLRLGSGGNVMRSWIVQYRRAGATRRVLLGSAEVLSAEQARTAAKKVLGWVALGEDPQADKRARRDKDRLSLRSIIDDEYLPHKAGEVRAKSLGELRRYLAGHYFRPLHGMPLDTITRRDVAARLVAITREHGSIIAAKARAALSGFFAWAMASGIVDSNPVIGTPRPSEGEPRERVLDDREIAAIWRACGDGDYGCIVRLLILLGARRAEVGGMEWPEIDIERCTWTLPPARSKNARAHELPLMPMALGIIEGVPRMVGRDKLFGMRADRGFSMWAHHKRALDARSGVVNWTIHDLRRSVATRLADLGVAPHVIEAILGHVSGSKKGVAGIYNRSSYANEVRNALALWEDHVRSLVTGGERKVIHIAPHAAR